MTPPLEALLIPSHALPVPLWQPGLSRALLELLLASTVPHGGQGPEGIPVIPQRSACAPFLATAAEGASITSLEFICVLLMSRTAESNSAAFPWSKVHSYSFGGHVLRGHCYSSSWVYLHPFSDQIAEGTAMTSLGLSCALLVATNPKCMSAAAPGSTCAPLVAMSAQGTAFLLSGAYTGRQRDWHLISNLHRGRSSIHCH